MGAETDFRAKWPDQAFEALEMLSGDARAITPPHQHAILGFAQIRDAHRQPYSDRRQRDSKGKGGHVSQHALAKIIGLIPRLLVARQIVRLGACVFVEALLARISRRTRHGARPEFKNPVLFLRGDGLLGIHCFQLRYMLLLACETAPLTDMFTCRGCDIYSSKVSWNLE